MAWIIISQSLLIQLVNPSHQKISSINYCYFFSLDELQDIGSTVVRFSSPRACLETCKVARKKACCRPKINQFQVLHQLGQRVAEMTYEQARIKNVSKAKNMALKSYTCAKTIFVEFNPFRNASRFKKLLMVSGSHICSDFLTTKYCKK